MPRKIVTLCKAVTEAGAQPSVYFQGEPAAASPDATDRIIQGTLTAGDTIELQASLDDSMWVTVMTFTDATFGGVVDDAWPYLRVNKVGTAGPATVKMTGYRP